MALEQEFAEKTIALFDDRPCHRWKMKRLDCSFEKGGSLQTMCVEEVKVRRKTREGKKEKHSKFIQSEDEVEMNSARKEHKIILSDFH